MCPGTPVDRATKGRDLAKPSAATPCRERERPSPCKHAIDTQILAQHNLCVAGPGPGGPGTRPGAQVQRIASHSPAATSMPTLQDFWIFASDESPSKRPSRRVCCDSRGPESSTRRLKCAFALQCSSLPTVIRSAASPSRAHERGCLVLGTGRYPAPKTPLFIHGGTALYMAVVAVFLWRSAPA